MIYSFDIFETILSRKTLTPKGIFSLMRQAIKHDSRYPVALRMHFFHVRIRAEIKARERLTDLEEITHEAIYEIIQEKYNLKDPDAKRLMALEVQMEIDSVYPIDETIFRIKQLLSSGLKVILISDMYLAKDIIRRILNRADPALSKLPIYLSSEIGLQKSTGNLYRHILEKEKIAPSQLKHVGDNDESDFVVPIRIGIKAEKFTESWLTEQENLIIQNYTREYDVTRQLAGGTVRKMRLHSLRGNRFTPMVSVFGPILYGFMHDTLKRILSSGKKRVYFISRDGRPLKIVADEIISAFDYPLETRYIHGSRQSWRQAAIFDPNYDLYWLGENFSGADFTLRQVLERIDHDAEKIHSLLPGKLRYRLSLERAPSEKDIQEVREAIISNKTLRDYIIDISRYKRKNAIKYFKKNNLLDDMPYALVDIGWSGKMQHCLYSILLSCKHDIHLDEYYFALDDSFAGCESDFDNIKHHYYIDMHLSGLHLFAFFMELFVQGDHGRCTGYNSDGKPVHCGDGQYLKNWGVHEYYDCLKIFVQDFVAAAQGVLYQERFQYLTNDISGFFSCPSKQMAELFGSLPFSEDQNDALMDEFAPALSPSDAKAAILGVLRLRWKEASLLRSSPQVKRLFKQTLYLQKLKNIGKVLTDQMKITELVRRIMKRLIGYT